MNEFSMPVMKGEELNLTLFVYIVFVFALSSSLFFFSPFLPLLSAEVFSRKAEFIELIFQKKDMQLLRHFTWNH